jgi:hypothetical protein
MSQTGQTGHPVAPGFVMDITIGTDPATDLPRYITPCDTIVMDVITAMGKAAEAWLSQHDCDAYALRLTAVPIEIRGDA